VAPLSCRSVGPWLVGSKDAIVSLDTSLTITTRVCDVVVVEDESYGSAVVITIGEATK